MVRQFGSDTAGEETFVRRSLSRMPYGLPGDENTALRKRSCAIFRACHGLTRRVTEVVRVVGARQTYGS